MAIRCIVRRLTSAATAKGTVGGANSLGEPTERWSGEGGGPNANKPTPKKPQGKHPNQKDPEKVYKSPEINQDREEKGKPKSFTERSQWGPPPDGSRVDVNQQRRYYSIASVLYKQQSCGSQKQGSTGRSKNAAFLSNRLFSNILRDHEHTSSLFRMYEQAEGTAKRRPILNSIVRILSIHAATEETVLYPAFKSSGFPQYQDQGRSEHQEVKNILDRVKDKDIDAQTDAELRQVMASVEQHVQWEESTALPHLAQQLSDSELNTLADKWDAQWKAAPTRPHPNAPNTGGIAQKASGTMAAGVDYVRDKNLEFVDDDFVRPLQGTQ